MDNKIAKFQGLVYILMGIMDKTMEHLMKEEWFNNLTSDRKSDLWVEFLFFNLHQLDRTFFAWFGAKRRDELMDGVLVETYRVMDTGLSEDSPNKEAYDNLSPDNLEENPEFRSRLEDFLSHYNKAQDEYAQYSDNPKKGEGLSGTLLWEFGKKMAEFVGKKDDISIIMKVSAEGTAWTFYSDSMKEVIETGQIGEMDFKKET